MKPCNCFSDSIVNLSKHELTHLQASVLVKGLSFIPKVKDLDTEELYRDFCTFEKRITREFNNKTGNDGQFRPHTRSYTRKNETGKGHQSTQTGRGHQSTLNNKREIPYIPDILKDHRGSINKFKYLSTPGTVARPSNMTLNLYLQTVKEELFNLRTLSQSKSDNMTRKQRLALKSLIENKDIVINKADKGSTIVIMDREQYIADGLKHLRDPTTYKSLAHDTTDQTKRAIKAKLTKMKKEGFLHKEYYEHCLPPTKHRTSRLYFLKKIHKTPMGIRPIVSSTNSHLQTNTSHPAQPEPEVIGKLMDIVLRNNIFEFNDKFYIQLQGTAMGTKWPQLTPIYSWTR